MLLYHLLIISTLSVYSIVILIFSFGWSRKKSFLSSQKIQEENVSISIVIAVRNEIQNLSELISSLKEQNYPKHNFEVIFIDDHSTDNSVTKIESEITGIENFEVYSLSEGLCGKKEALNYGISKATGELISFTDADCIVGINWLNCLNQFYLNKNKPDLIIGLVDLAPTNTLWEKIFRIDFLSLIISSAGSAAINHPILCNGANLAIKRSEITNKKMFNLNRISGDDIFLLHSLKSRNKHIELLKSEQHLVTTPPPSSINEFLSQRIRWGSKASSYRDIDTIILSFLVLITNISGIALLFSSILTFDFHGLVIYYIIKLISDFILFISGADFFKLKKQLIYIALIELVYPIYIFITLLAIIKKPFQFWKGRKLY